MKVLLVNKYWYLKGGSERVLFLTKQVLEAHGHEVEIFGMKHPKNEFENEYFVDHIDYSTLSPVQKIRVGFQSIYNTDAKKKFAALIDAFQPDVVHFHNIYHQLSFALLEVVKEKKIHSVMTLHDYKLLSPNYMLYHHGHIDDVSLGKKYYRCILNNCMESMGESIVATLEAYVRSWKQWNKVIDTYICPSVFMKDMCIKGGIDEKKLRVIANPIDIDMVQRQNVHADEGDSVVYMGRLSVEKGTTTLVQAAALLPDIPFIIAGDGPLRTQLEKIVQDKHIQNVSFVGHVHGEVFRAIVEQARIIVVPSEWYENAPMSIVEAKAAKKMVIASNIGGIPEMLPEELLVPPHSPFPLAKQIETWYTASSQTREAMRERLYQSIAAHDPQTYYHHLLQTYNLST